MRRVGALIRIWSVDNISVQVTWTSSLHRACGPKVCRGVDHKLCTSLQSALIISYVAFRPARGVCFASLNVDGTFV